MSGSNQNVKGEMGKLICPSIIQTIWILWKNIPHFFGGTQQLHELIVCSSNLPSQQRRSVSGFWLSNYPL